MNEYYSRISDHDYYSIVISVLPFNQQEWSILSKYGNLKYTSPSSASSITFKTDARLENGYEYKSSLHIPKRVYKSERVFIHIRKFEDEWFYIDFEAYDRNHIEFYKCDQFDGLIELLNDMTSGPLKESSYIEINTDITYPEVSSNKSEMCDDGDLFYINSIIKKLKDDGYINEYYISIHTMVGGRSSKYSGGSWRVANGNDNYIKVQFGNDNNIQSIEIWRYKDEWYEVNISCLYGVVLKKKNFGYKCDQLTGVKDLILKWILPFKGINS